MELVLLKPGSIDPPVFLSHGLGGTVTELSSLVPHLQLLNPVYGLQTPGVEGTEPLESIEEMAQFSLSAIRRAQPRGPYFLVGYSLGGLVALETARRLSRAGEAIGLLTLIDSYPHLRHLSPQQGVRLIASRVRRRMSRALQSNSSHPAPAASFFDPALNRVRESSYRAWKNYRPSFYRGSISFVKASIATNFPGNPTAVWSPLTDTLYVETVPGDHLTLLTTHAAALGSFLTRRLQAALRAEPLRGARA